MIIYLFYNKIPTGTITGNHRHWWRLFSRIFHFVFMWLGILGTSGQNIETGAPLNSTYLLNTELLFCNLICHISAIECSDVYTWKLHFLLRCGYKQNGELSESLKKVWLRYLFQMPYWTWGGALSTSYW